MCVVGPGGIWLDVTNLALGLILLVCLIFIGKLLCRELCRRRRTSRLMRRYSDDSVITISHDGIRLTPDGRGRGRRKLPDSESGLYVNEEGLIVTDTELKH